MLKKFLFVFIFITFFAQNFFCRINFYISPLNNSHSLFSQQLSFRSTPFNMLFNAKENKYRRFEIIFFSSGAVIYFTSYLLARLFAEINLGHSSELPDSYWYFIIVNSIGMATYISIHDYTKNNISNLVYNKNTLSIKKNFITIKF